MKNLIYSSGLLCVFLSFASCTKNDAIQPKKDLNSASVSPGCDSAQLANYVITNLTGDASYEIAFSGPKNYTFSFPTNGSATISVKPGTYNVFIYSPGNYTAHSISLNDQAPVKESGARIDGVLISPCSGAQAVKIAQ